jgi:hypothetical protein
VCVCLGAAHKGGAESLALVGHGVEHVLNGEGAVLDRVLDVGWQTTHNTQHTTNNTDSATSVPQCMYYIKVTTCVRVHTNIHTNIRIEKRFCNVSTPVYLLHKNHIKVTRCIEGKPKPGFLRTF